MARRSSLRSIFFSPFIPAVYDRNIFHSHLFPRSLLSAGDVDSTARCTSRDGSSISAVVVAFLYTSGVVQSVLILFGLLDQFHELE